MSHAHADRRRTGVQLSLLAGSGVRADADRAGHTVQMAVGSAISLFSGAGGLDLGIEAAGFRTVSAVEWDEDAADTMGKNAPAFFPELQEVVRGDLYPLAAGGVARHVG